MSTCNTCGSDISWDQSVRASLNWRGPLNPDGTKHLCYARMKEKEAVVRTESVQSDKVESLQSLSLSQEEIRMFKDYVATKTWPVAFSDEEIRVLRAIIQLFQDFKKK